MQLMPAAIRGGAALCAVLLLLGADRSKGPVTADSTATVFIESKSATIGDGFSTEVIVILPPETSLRSFDVELAFDERSLIPVGLRLTDGWESVSQPPARAGFYRLAAERSSATCEGPGSCTLAAVTWKAQAAGDSSIRVTAAQLQAETGPLPTGAMTAGLVRIPDAEPAETSVSGRAGAGLANLAVVLLVSGAAGLLLTLPTVFAIRRLRGRRSVESTPLWLGSSRPTSRPPLDFGRTATDYFEELELAGRIFTEPDPLLERMARETSAQSIE